MLYVGIDIAKRSHTVAIVDDKGCVRGRPFSITNTAAGLQRLLQRVAQANLEQAPVLFGIEATGHYWLPLFSHLKDQGHNVAALNPLQTSGYRKRQIRPVKNDRIDSICIAEVLRQEPLIQTTMADETVLGLRTLSRFRVELV